MVEGQNSYRLGSGRPSARVQVHDARAYAALLRSGSVGLGTAYVAGWWDADDLTVLMRELLVRARPLLARMDRLGRAVSGVVDVAARLAPPTRTEDASNIRAHYDLSNEFFELMLDETMTYSCGVFEHREVDLRDAQMAKIDGLSRSSTCSPVTTSSRSARAGARSPFGRQGSTAPR